MSGPSLHKLDAHRSIHDGAVTEGRDLLEVLEKVYEDKREKHAMIAAKILIDHWETRTIAHADSEEEEFYETFIKEDPNMHDTITKLKHDHDLLRNLIHTIKDILDENGVNDDVIDRFKAIYILVQMHNDAEEQYLLSK